MFRAPAIELAIWLNQYRAGQITKSDARNACETITDNEILLVQDDVIDWTAFLAKYVQSSALLPIACALPTAGNSFGIPHYALREFDLSAGLVVIENEMILGRDLKRNWVVNEVSCNLIPAHLASSRLTLLDLISEAEDELAALHLFGDRTSIDDELFKLRPLHLPPGLPTKVKQDLELAERIWLVTQYALKESEALASPSGDRRRIELLTSLSRISLELMAAASSVS